MISGYEKRSLGVKLGERFLLSDYSVGQIPRIGKT